MKCLRCGYIKVNFKTSEFGGLSKRKNGFRVINYSYNSVPKLFECLYGDKRGMRLVIKVELME